MIHVFDALGTFTADTSQLDQFTIKLEQGLTGASQKAASATIALKAAQDEFRASIAAVNAEGGKSAENMLRLAAAEEQLALAAAAARQEHTALRSSLTDAGNAAEQTTVKMEHARGEAMLLGEEFGIHLPRHVTSFLASIPGVGAALEAAFSATAVLFLIQALAQGAEKLSAWISDTFIFTDAMKQESATIAETNKAILAQVDAFNKAKEALDEFELNGSSLTQHKIDELTDSINKNNAAFRATEDQLYGLHNDFVGVTGDVGLLSNKLNELTAVKKALNEQLELLQKQHDEQQTQEVIKAEEDRIEAAKTSTSARIALAESEALTKLAIVGGNYSQIIGIQQKAEADQLNLELRSIQGRISALAFEGDKTKDDRAKLSAEIEKLIDDHNAKVYAIYAKAFNDLRSLSKEEIPFITVAPPGLDQISNDITKAFEQAEQAAQALGITLKSDLDTGLQSAFEAYSKLIELQKQGIVTQRDVDKGYEQLIRTELNYAQETGASATAVTKLKQQLLELLQAELAHAKAAHASAEEIQKYERAIENLNGKQRQSISVTKEWSQVIEEDLQSGATAFKLFEDTAVGVVADFVQNMQQAFTELVEGQKSFGAAMEEAGAKAVAALASYWAKYFIGRAIADAFDNPGRAAAEFAAAAALEALAGTLGAVGNSGGSGSGRSSSAGSGAVSPSTVTNGTAQSGPAQVVNVTHLATGGIATGPTLAMIAEGGKASEEAIIPLHDSNAINKIAAAFFEPIQRLARSSPNLSIPSSLIYAEDGGSRGTAVGVSGGITRQDVQAIVQAIGATRPDLGHLEITLQSDIDQVVKTINHRVSTGRSRLLASNSIRLTKRS